MKKIYEVLIDTLSQLNSSGYMKMLLKQYNIHLLFNPLYETFNNPKDADFLSAFIILAYSNKCSWIMNMDKDRRTVKVEIANSILVESQIQISEDIELTAIKSNTELFLRVSDAYIQSQKNRLFARYISLSEHISACNRKGMDRDINVKDTDLRSRTQTLNDLEETERQLMEVQAQIEREYTTLDEALKKENRKPISKDINIFDYEEMLSKYAYSQRSDT